MTWIESVRRWLVKLDHLDHKGHWPDAIFYDQHMVCKKCQRGGGRSVGLRMWTQKPQMVGLR